MTGTWKFPPNNGGQIEGFNQASIDIWQGSLIFSVVRETIQNAIDARAGLEPAKVSFSFHDIPAPTEIRDLETYLESAKQYVARSRTDGENSDAHSIAQFYENAIASVKKAGTTFFAIQDYNTSGLEGTTNPAEVSASKSKWIALVKSTGVSVQNNASAGGAFGHGSKAPFALGSLRTLFYLTECNGENGTQRRFQGKAILQSMILDSQQSVITQGTGYFGTNSEANLDPIFNDDVPSWASDIRNSRGSGRGTSILIPFPRAENTDQLRTKLLLSVLANFYVAILDNKLSVRIGDGDEITSSNIRDIFEHTLAIYDDRGSESYEDLKDIDDFLEACKTLHTPDSFGHQEIDGFGAIDWYLRVNENCAKGKVGIARDVGMLITRQAPRLMKFPSTRPFDMFVIVRSDEAASALRSLENPAHDAFEFDRITDIEKLQKVKALYTKFQDGVRKIIKDHAYLDVENEVSIPDFDGFLDGVANDSSEPGNERLSPTIEIGPIRKIRLVAGAVSPEIGDGDHDGQGRGVAGGDKKHKTKGGNINDPGGNTPTKESPKQRSVKNLRIIREKNSNVATVIFTPLATGKYDFRLYRSGETDRSAIKVRTLDSTSEWKEVLPLNANQRHLRVKLKLEFRPGDLDFALEGLTSDGK